MAASCAMKLSPGVAQPQLARRAASRVSAKVALPLRNAARANVVTRAQQTESPLQTVGLKVEQAIAVSTAVSTFLVAGNAQAAQEIAAIAADNRLGTISLLFLPVIGWVGFNILGPALRQLDSMSGDSPAPKKGTSRVTKKKGLAAAVGLTAASMFALSESANAATEFAQVADSDGRLGAILTLFLPALGWVAFNIAGPALRQLDSMSGDSPAPKKAGTSRVTKKRGLAAAAGLTAAASMFAVESANAATELAQVADSDGRLGAILTLFVPALGWVAFNIAGPALRQLNSMSDDSPAPKKAGTSRVTKRK